MARSSCSSGSLGKSRPVSVADDVLELGRQLAQVVGGQVRVLRGAVGLLGGLERVVEALALHVHDDPPEHLDEAPVGVPAEALVAGQRDEPVERLLVEPEVEDRVHHPGHRELGARADGHEQRIGSVAEALAGLRLDLVDRLEDVVPEPVRELLAGGEVVVAGLGRDGEAGRHRKAGVGHLGEAGALAAEQVAHRGVALGLTAAPGVDVALRRAVGTVGGRGSGLGHRAGPSRAAATRGRPRSGSQSVSERLYRRTRLDSGCGWVARATWRTTTRRTATRSRSSFGPPDPRRTARSAGGRPGPRWRTSRQGCRAGRARSRRRPTSGDRM